MEKLLDTVATFINLLNSRPTTRKEGYVSETLKVTGIYVYEKTATKTTKENKEAKENKIEWLLLTNIEIKSDKEAIDIINYYVQR